jgi:hypothetical protein
MSQGTASSAALAATGDVAGALDGAHADRIEQTKRARTTLQRAESVGSADDADTEDDDEAPTSIDDEGVVGRRTVH